MDKVQFTVDYLNHCKSVYMAAADFTFQKSLGIDEVEDLLNGISHDGHDCFVSHLFSQLTSDEKQQVQALVDFTIDFEGLAAYYAI